MKISRQQIIIFFVSNLSHKEMNRYLYELDYKQIKRTTYEMLKCPLETINITLLLKKTTKNYPMK